MLTKKDNSSIRMRDLKVGLFVKIVELACKPIALHFAEITNRYNGSGMSDEIQDEIVITMGCQHFSKQLSRSKIMLL